MKTGFSNLAFLWVSKKSLLTWMVVEHGFEDTTGTHILHVFLWDYVTPNQGVLNKIEQFKILKITNRILYPNQYFISLGNGIFARVIHILPYSFFFFFNFPLYHLSRFFGIYDLFRFQEKNLNLNRDSNLGSPNH